MWHPLRLAEDYAMADVLTRGRIIFGVGRGYQTREVESFGAPLLDREANRELFEEQIEIILKAFNQESFSHQGKYYTLPAPVEYRGYQLRELTLVPRPVHRPVEIWQPVSSGRSIEFMAKNGIKAMLSLNGEKLTEHIMHEYQQQCAKYGRDTELGQDTCLGMGFCLDDTQARAMERVRPYHDERYKWFAPFGFVRYTDEHGRMWGTPGAPARLPLVEDGVQQKAWLCGPPEHFIEQLREIEAKYPGLEHIMLQYPEGMPLAEFKEQLRIFGEEVMPAFKDSTTAVAD
jgi:alkanesulfonate monooxygenase SsuD/methylene tetrahydromethanopterin reductase-like flavin-dependent oxidoreductase (luciferase family)